tara:strand:+ start:340 stop:1227 length:888 start_codon:yes stop_codon:yes gene_type:complete
MKTKLLKENFFKQEKDISEKLYAAEQLEGWDILNDIREVLDKEGYRIIGEGFSRLVFSKDDLQFVIKLASRQQGVSANQSEIQHSIGSASSTIKDILPEIYSYSKDESGPLWLICEKVKPIVTTTLPELSKVFPTFYRIASKGPDDNFFGVKTLSKDVIIKLVSMTYKSIAKGDISNIDDIINLILSLCSNNHDSVERIKKEEELKDIKKFINATNYDFTADLAPRNLGIKLSNNSTPDDFVILDFDVNAIVHNNKKIIKKRHVYDLKESVYTKLLNIHHNHIKSNIYLQRRIIK